MLRNVDAFEMLKKAKKWIFELPKKEACQHVEFIPEKPFHSSDLQNYKINLYCFKPLSLSLFVTKEVQKEKEKQQKM